jgi:hypothetical protein
MPKKNPSVIILQMRLPKSHHIPFFYHEKMIMKTFLPPHRFSDDDDDDDDDDFDGSMNKTLKKKFNLHINFIHPQPDSVLYSQIKIPFGANLINFF